MVLRAARLGKSQCKVSRITCSEFNRTTVVKKLSVPDLLPEDLAVRPHFSLFDRPEPRRRSRLEREELNIEAS